jgi:UDP-3-O-[3-hydroxymyristoyl] glucosamine N-acyltransferase
MEFSLKELSELINGKLIGDGSFLIKGISDLENAKPYDIVFVFNKNYVEAAKRSRSNSVVIPKDLTIDGKRNLIVVENPKVAMIKVLKLFERHYTPSAHIHPSSIIEENVTIGKDVSIGPFVIIKRDAVINDGVILYPNVYIGENSSIGSNTIVYSNVVIYPDTKIGKGVIIHANATIGSDGFGYMEMEGKGAPEKIPQCGGVIIEDEVEIGANSSIDRSTLGNTLIGKGTKIDNLVQIAHNVKIGKNCRIASQVGISGSVSIGNNVTIAGQVGIADHVNIGDYVTIAAKSGVTKDIPSKCIVSGFPARSHEKEKRIKACISKLPDLFKKVREIEGLVLKKKRS